VVKDTGYQLISAAHMEDKIAGCMMIEKALSQQATLEAAVELQRVSGLFALDLIIGWAVTDCMSQRVLATLVKEVRNRAHSNLAERQCQCSAQPSCSSCVTP
jgi:hypothetical protein